jgi:hypothetical protein
LPLLFQLLFRICHQEAPRKEEALELNGTLQLLVCAAAAAADDDDIWGENINVINKNIEASLQAGIEFGIEVNTEKT